MCCTVYLNLCSSVSCRLLLHETDSSDVQRKGKKPEETLSTPFHENFKKLLTLGRSNSQLLIRIRGVIPKGCRKSFDHQPRGTIYISRKIEQDWMEFSASLHHTRHCSTLWELFDALHILFCTLASLSSSWTSGTAWAKHNQLSNHF